MDVNSKQLCELFAIEAKEGLDHQDALKLARRTAEILRTIIAKTKITKQADLIELLRRVGVEMQKAAPLELCIGNITRRVIYFAREEFSRAVECKDDVPSMVRTRSLENYLLGDSQQLDQNCAFHSSVKQEIITQIKEMLDDMESVTINIAEQSVEHIHANEVILSHGHSRTVVKFLHLAAEKGRTFEVIVAETAPRLSGHVLAMELAKRPEIKVTVVPDSAIFAVMSRVNKVIVGTHAVLANGGLCGYSGLHTVALAAKYHSVPVVVCTGLYKLCPLYPHDQDSFNLLRSPNEILRSDEVQRSEYVRVLNPEFDYVPPDLVHLFVTNLGGHSPSYIYRLLNELYNHEDYNLDRKQKIDFATVLEHAAA